MRTLLRLISCILIVLALAPAAASAAPRMLVGFQDDVSFRWRTDRKTVLDAAEQADASILRTTVNWAQVAKRRPANPTDPFDPAYNFSDVDEFVRAAQIRDMEVLLTIWGTPSWANPKGRNHVPRSMADFAQFSYAVAARYSGRYPGYPFVRYYSIWNEPNLEQFLAPQFDKQGHDASPALYARLCRAAYGAIKAGNALAQVAIGETSARGRDHLNKGKTQETHSPGRFAQLLARQRPKVPFDAWAHHPYPTSPGLKPTQRVRWPNVTLTMMPRFESSLDSWFGRHKIPIWITEYGHETRPEERRGVTYAQQALYAKQALSMAAADSRVRMFIWYTLRDDSRNTWQSGLLRPNGTKKPSFEVFAGLAKTLDARNAVVSVVPGTVDPTIRIPTVEFGYFSPVGAPIGVDYHVWDPPWEVVKASPEVPLDTDGWITLHPGFTPEAGHRYELVLTLYDPHGNRLERTLELVAPIAQ